MNNFERIVIVGCGDLAKELVSWMIHSELYERIGERLFYIDDLHNKDFYVNKIKINYLCSVSKFVPEKKDKLYHVT